MKPPEVLQFLLQRISSWTNASFDQQVRYQFGDEVANQFLVWLTQHGVSDALLLAGKSFSNEIPRSIE